MSEGPLKRASEEEVTVKINTTGATQLEKATYGGQGDAGRSLFKAR